MHNATIQRRATTQTGVDPGRELLQARMSLFGRIGAAFSAVYLVLVNAFPTEPKSWQDILFCTSNGIILAVATVFLLAWLLTRAATIEGRMLLAVDTAAIVLVGLLTAAYGWLTIRELSFSYNGVLAITNAMCFRAALIPSSARRTLLVGLAATLPTVSLALAHTLMPAWSVLGSGMLGFVLAWCAVGVGISTVISGVIFGLQQQARRAERLGQYELMERIGAGAMGEVYRARHAMLRRPTAIKLLQPRIAGAGNILRFEREVQHTAALTHPNTIAIYDYGRTPDGLFYYAMEYLDGTDLQRLVEREGPQPPARVIHILRQICGSLAEAHEAGLVHRDIKAANVFLCQRGGLSDVIKVLDFGLVRRVDDRGEVHLAGTPSYLAPEAIQHPALISPLADLYAVGVLAYHLLTAAMPIDGPSVPVILSRQVGDDPEPPSSKLDHDLPEDLEQLVMACLAKDPTQRPASARALASALAACADADGSPVPAPPTRLATGISAAPHTADTTLNLDEE